MYLNMKGKFKKNTMSDKKGERRFEFKLDGLVSLSLVKLMVNANEC